jgi:DNA-binding IclR family transcriptional regulator
MPLKNGKYYFVSSLAKGLRILDLLANNGELSASEVAKFLDTNRAESHRFLSTLTDCGYLEKTKEKRFRLSFKTLEIGMKKLDGFEIRLTAHPFMQDLANTFSETVNLGYWDGKSIVHLSKINSTEILRIDVGLGALAPAYCTGLGKSILAFLPEEDLEKYLKSVSLSAMSSKTITTIKSFKSEISRIRTSGYAIDDEELSIGLRCVGAPVFDYRGMPVYALSVAGPSQRMSKDRILRIKEKLLPCCNQLSAQIGAPKKVLLSSGKIV